MARKTRKPHLRKSHLRTYRKKNGTRAIKLIKCSHVKRSKK